MQRLIRAIGTTGILLAGMVVMLSACSNSPQAKSAKDEKRAEKVDASGEPDDSVKGNATGLPPQKGSN